ncbi:Hypothetical predicted protein [Lecanosticta acicola]|uniref:Beta-lactamase/transpeptidase-like protein n=1 Tax=Lecanosticta acicola TaxID=111012 RepID=A0AAI8Z1R2_9PEZI|nr:Hypothetical predicted protein [Lecanosticta acicola]
MSALLPGDFVMNEESYTRDVTVEDILSHRSGLPSHDNSYLSPRATHPDTAKTVTQNLRNLPLAAPIRTKYMYCNMMLTVATHLIEELTSTTFESFLHTRVFSKLGMNSTHLQPGAAIKAGLKDRMSTPYAWDERSKAFIALPYEEGPEMQGAGGIITSVNDYALWIRELIHHEGTVISEDLYNGILRPRILENPDATDEDLPPFSSWEAYATGFETYFYRGYRIVRHDGLIGGFGTTHFFVPAIKFGGAIFANSGETGNSAAVLLMRELVDEALGIPEDQRSDWKGWQAKTDEESATEREEEHKKLREELCPPGEERQPHKMPLNAYTGSYFNAGYHGLVVQVQGEKLFIDASDRSMGFTLTLEHMCSGKTFLAHLQDAADPTDTDQLKAEFQCEGDRALKMGLHLEADLDDLIWFDRVDAMGSEY